MTDTQRAKSIFLEATEKPLDQRSAYLDQACAGDDALRRHVEALLQAHDFPQSFLERPIFQLNSEKMATTAPINSSQQAAVEIPGGKVKQYKLLQRIGEGGFGVVFLAEQEEPIRRRVALKIIKPGMDSQQVIARFEAERQALAMMDHQNIARVLDAGTTDTGYPFFVMELIKGVPITEFCDRNQLSLTERLRLLVPVCQAIHHAHQKGIIHRDIKPSNVLVSLFDGQPVPKVIDFGVAKAISHHLTEKTLFTEYGQLVGTPEYMSPEQAELNQLDVDTRSDVYSLGVLLYMLLTGSTPITRQELLETGLVEMLRVIREKEPECPSMRLTRTCHSQPEISKQRRLPPARLSTFVKGELDWIAMKALEKNRGRRYDSANELAMDIQRYLNDEPVSACPPSKLYQLRKLASKHRKSFLVASAVCVMLLVAVAISLSQARYARVAKQLALQHAYAEHEARLSAEAAIEAEQKQRDAAIAFAKDAETQKKLADENAVSATQRAAEAAAAQRQARENLYVAHMNLVGNAMATGNLPTAKRLLARYQPETDQPGFEWYYWKRQSEIIKPHSSIAIPSHRTGISADGKTLASSLIVPGSASVNVLNLQTKQIQNLPNLAGAVALSSDGQQLALASPEFEPFKISLRDLRLNGKTEEIVTDTAVHELVYAPGNQRLAARMDKSVALWDVALDSPTHPLARQLVLQDAVPTSLEYALDGKSLLVGFHDGQAALWDLTSEDQPVRFQCHSMQNVLARFVPQSKLILLTTVDGSVELWNIETRQRLTSYNVGDQQAGLIAVSSDGNTLFAGSRSGLVKVVDLRSGAEQTRFLADKSFLAGVHFLPGDNLVVTTGGELNLWQFNSVVSRILIQEPAESLAVSPDGSVFSCRNCLRRMHEPTRTPLKLTAAVLSAEFSHQGQLLATGANNGEVELWNPSTGQSLRKLSGHSRHVGALAFSPDDKLLASGSMDWQIKLWAVSSGNCLHTLSDQKVPVESVHFSTDGRMLASAHSDRKLRLWEVETGKLKATITASEHPIQHVRFSPDGRWLATAAGSTISFWDLKELQNPQPAKTLIGHSDLVWWFEFTGDGATIASASQDHSVRLWDVSTGDEKAKFAFPKPVRTLRFFENDSRLAVGTGENVTILVGS